MFLNGYLVAVPATATRTTAVPGRLPADTRGFLELCAARDCYRLHSELAAGRGTSRFVGGQYDAGATSADAAAQPGSVDPHHGALGAAGDRDAHSAGDRPAGRPGRSADRVAFDSISVTDGRRADPQPPPRSSTTPESSKAATALKGCRAKVQAGDKVRGCGQGWDAALVGARSGPNRRFCREDQHQEDGRHLRAHHESRRRG